MSALYFAYGSNLKSDRLRERIGEHRSRGPGHLGDHRFRLNKLGADGSAKANLEREPGARVWGVVYEIATTAWPTLDGFEGGYQRVEIQVTLQDGARHPATTYLSERLTSLPPHAAYCTLILEGAREHALPPTWIHHLETLSGDGVD